MATERLQRSWEGWVLDPGLGQLWAWLQNPVGIRGGRGKIESVNDTYRGVVVWNSLGIGGMSFGVNDPVLAIRGLGVKVGVSMPKNRTTWWMWPSLLSLDAPLVAVSWLYMFAGAWQVRYLSWAAYATLALGVWWIYVVDRLLDYRLRGEEDDEVGVRHRFHMRHRKKFIAGLVVASLVIIVLVLGFLPVELLFSYVVPAVILVVLFFGMVVSASRDGEIPYMRNLVAGLAFGFGTAMIAHMRVTTEEMASMLRSREMLSFGVLCALNITAIHLWEHSRRSDDREVKAADELTLTLPLTGLAAVALIFASMENPWMFGHGDDAARPFFYAVLMSASLLQVINRVRSRFSLEALRTLADLAMIAPLPLFVLWRGF